MTVHEFSDSFALASLALASQATGAGAVRRTPAVDLTYQFGDVQALVPVLGGAGTVEARWVEADAPAGPWTVALADAVIITGGGGGTHAAAKRVRSFDRRYVAIEVETAGAATVCGAVLVAQKTDR